METRSSLTEPVELTLERRSLPVLFFYRDPESILKRSVSTRLLKAQSSPPLLGVGKPPFGSHSYEGGCQPYWLHTRILGFPFQGQAGNTRRRTVGHLDLRMPYLQVKPVDSVSVTIMTESKASKIVLFLW